MKKNIILIIAMFSIASCNFSEVENLKEELSIKQDSIRLLQSQVAEMEKNIKELNEIVTSQNQIATFSNEEIISIFKRDREFNTPKGERKNFVVKMINKNIYQIRYEYRHPEYLSYKDWSTSIYQIEFFPNDQYRLRWVKGNEL